MEEHRLLNDRYELIEQLGKGGMAVVYRARDRMLERLVAVKVLREDYTQDKAFLDRFRQEAKAAANLSHPNIVTVHDFGLDQGQLFIVMEFVPGTDLKTLVKQRGRFHRGGSRPPARTGLRRDWLCPSRRAGTLRCKAAKHAGHAGYAP